MVDLEGFEKFLDAPKDPRLVVMDAALSEAFSPADEVFSLPDVPTPMTDWELVERFEGRGIRSSYRSWRASQELLNNHGIAYDRDSGQWLRNGQLITGRAAPSSTLEFFELRALAEIAFYETYRLAGALMNASMAIDGRVVREIDDPEKYLDPDLNHTSRRLTLLGTDPVDGSVRVTSGSVDAIKFYFGV